MYDILIIGGGGAGLTAATYARRAGKRVLIVEKNAFGGQITWSPKVENFPGYVSITGAALGDKLDHELTLALPQELASTLGEVWVPKHTSRTQLLNVHGYKQSFSTCYRQVFDTF